MESVFSVDESVQTVTFTATDVGIQPLKIVASNM